MSWYHVTESADNEALVWFVLSNTSVLHLHCFKRVYLNLHEFLFLKSVFTGLEAD
ncbi:hypothetical protein E2C01_004459 [Portunus trituberculatus]|uniref:Uncharacterized protein n=1 Tax=Portunus trituberculatus TaxID=210409 RepID=A0A5B7CT18_PORTR|nr:hypothetical protein [Portunus trituberculatus]